jgi:hypothetical protein
MRKRIQYTLLVFLGLFVSILIAVSGYLGVQWSNLTLRSRVTVAASLVGALGTLVLATATVWTALQNQKLVNERVKEAERPLVTEELEDLLIPYCQVVRNNIAAVEGSSAIDWSSYSPRKALTFDGIRTSKAEPVPLLQTDDVHLYTRLERDAPELWKMIQTHDELLDEIAELGDQISRLLEPAVKRYLEDYGLSSEFDEGEIRTLNGAILKQANQYGEQNDHADIWAEHRDDLCSILDEVAADEYDELQKEINRFRTHCEELGEELVERRINLQNEYSISIDEDETGPVEFV